MYHRLLTLFLTAFLGSAAAQVAPAAPLTPPSPAPCGPRAPAAPVARSLPPVVTGRVSFYAAEYHPTTLKPLRSVSLGDTNALRPLASLFKPLIVQGVLQDVDAGKLKLGTPLTTTAANRSIENYPPGTNTLQVLARRAIYLSDNTASDILQLAYGPERLARAVRSVSPCTSVLLTTKAWWAAQAGLAPNVFTEGPAAGSRRYAAQPFEGRLATAAALIAASQKVTGPVVERDLDRYFHGPTYDAGMEVDLQNTSTAQAFTDLMAVTLSGRNLKSQTRQVFRDMLATGCCRPKTPALVSRYWAGKAGSGWGILNLTGFVETTDGRVFAYTYFNDRSVTTDAEDMEQQIRPVVLWIEQVLLDLKAAP